MLSLDLHADTRRIADLLNEVPRGDSITLDAISKAIDRDIRRCRYLLYSALRVVERESGAVFATERGSGYRRLAPEEIVKIGQTARARIRGWARRGSRTIAAGIAGANDMAPDTARKIMAEQSALGLLEHIARDRSLPKVNEDENRPLSVAATAKEFLRSIGSNVA